MEKPADVVLVSVYGRGLWLANKFFEAGLRVTFVDVTSQMGRIAEGETEGPLGFWGFESWPVDQQSRLEDGGKVNEVEGGLQVWLNNGPVEFHGPLTDRRLQGLGLDPLAVEFVRGLAKNPVPLKMSQLNLLGRLPFERTWIEALSRNLGSAQYFHPADRAESAEHLNILERYFVHRGESECQKTWIASLKERGVEIYEPAQVVDILTHGGKMDAIEVKSSRSGVVKGNRFVWMLTTEETKRLPPAVLEKLFAGKSLANDWYWTCFEAEIKNAEVRAGLPKNFLIIEDLLLPWTHENFMVVQQTGAQSPERYRIWIRLPMSQRFQKGYMEMRTGIVRGLFEKRIPAAGFEIREMPKEYHLNFDELGVPLFPIRGAHAKSLDPVLKNVFVDGPEWWPRLDWKARFECQNEIFMNLMNRYNKENQKLKGDGRDSAVHAP